MIPRWVRGWLRRRADGHLEFARLCFDGAACLWAGGDIVGALWAYSEAYSWVRRAERLCWLVGDPLVLDWGSRERSFRPLAYRGA